MKSKSFTSIKMLAVISQLPSPILKCQQANKLNFMCDPWFKMSRCDTRTTPLFSHIYLIMKHTFLESCKYFSWHTELCQFHNYIGSHLLSQVTLQSPPGHNAIVSYVKSAMFLSWIPTKPFVFPKEQLCHYL